MITRVWRGWTRPADADRYQRLLETTVLPGIAARRIPGLTGTRLYRKTDPDRRDEVEFMTVMTFDGWDGVREFAGGDGRGSVVPPAARALLARYDERSRHYEDVVAVPQHAAGAGDVFSGRLLADEPWAATSDAMGTFGQFVGDWDVKVQYLGADGTLLFDGPGVWAFRLVLDGRAVQDVLRIGQPSADSGEPRQLGSSIRFLDEVSGQWHVTWVGVASQTCAHLVGGEQPDGSIEISGIDHDGDRLTWRFSDIADDSFTWTGSIREGDAGEAYVHQTMRAVRRG
jgi:hypothetical protein